MMNIFIGQKKKRKKEKKRKIGKRKNWQLFGIQIKKNFNVILSIQIEGHFQLPTLGSIQILQRP